MAVVMPAHRTFTIDDLDRFPDDGNRYELIEGSLHVTPSPGMPHQAVVGNLYALLRSTCPPELRVWLSPLDVVLGPDTVVEPDLLVLAAELPHTERVHDAPLLAVEVLSPSTRSYDLGLKLRVYRETGVGAYWVVDPTAPSVTAWTWSGDEVVAEVTGDERLEATWPFPVTVVAADLVG